MSDLKEEIRSVLREELTLIKDELISFALIWMAVIIYLNELRKE